MTNFEEFVDQHLKSIRVNTGIIQYAPTQNFLGLVVVYQVGLGRQVVAVLDFLFEKVFWTDDLKKGGKVEHWGLPIFKKIDGVSAWRGDCDDFMAAFRLIIRKLGWDERVLRKAVCFVPTEKKPKPDFDGDINHALLCVNFSSGLLFLDNRFHRPMPLSRLRQQGYTGFSVCSAVDGSWQAVNPV